MRKLAAAVAFLLGAVGCAPVVERAEAQAVVSPNPQGNQQTLTPACVAPTSSGGNVDVSIPSNDYVSLNGAACGTSALDVALRYNAGTSYIEFGPNGNGLISTTSAAAYTCGGGIASGTVCLNVQTSGAKICLANGSDCLSDSSGTATFSGSISATSISGGTSVTGTNITASNTVVGQTNICAGSSGEICMQGNGTARDRIQNTQQHVDLIVANGSGGGDYILPKIANASLLTCTSATEDATHAPSGAIAYDTTNNCVARCNGSAWACLASDSTGATDIPWTIYDPVTAIGTTGDVVAAWGPSKSAMTLQDATYLVPVLGGGTGTLTTKLCTVAGCGSGTTFATCSIACNATAGTTSTCTINTAAVPVATTLHYAITSACSTADVTNSVSFHFSQP